MAYQLTTGAVARMMRKEDVKNPTLQAIHVKQVGSQERYRVILSDGELYMQGMLASQLNEYVTNGSMKENTILSVNEFIINHVQGKPVVIVLKLTLVETNATKIGAPVDAHASDASNSAPAAPASSSYGAPPPAPKATTGGYSNPYASRQPTNTYGSSSGPVGRASGESNIVPISALNPYQNRWTIKGRITNKGDMRKWSNAKGEGCLFSIDILDAGGMDIRGTFFKEDAEKWFNILEPEKVYTFTGGRLKVANPQYNKCKCQHEITFDRSTDIQLVEDDHAIKSNIYDFKKISEIESIEPDTIIDIIGVVVSVSPVSSITSKRTGNELIKCELTVLDDSNCEIRITLWGDKAKKAENEFDGCPVAAFKSVKVSDFGGRSLGSLNSSAISVNPKIEETEVIKTWYDNQGSASASSRKTMSGVGGGGNRDTFENRKHVSYIRDNGLGYNEKPDWLSFKGTISFIKKDKEGGPWYPACPNKEEPCRQMCKVVQASDSKWMCERCNKSYDNCCRRYIYSLTVVDDTSCTWATSFNDSAEAMLGGISANEMNQFLENGDTQKFEEIFQEALFSDWIFKCKVKNEMVNDEQRVKTSIYSMTKVDYVEESKNLLKAISSF